MKEEKIFLYYTSDLHSHFENWPKLMHCLQEKKEQRQRNHETYFLLDNGDHLDRFHPTTEAFLGKTNVDLLNQAKYHAVTLGNNEGITLEYDDLFHLYDQAEFSIVCANLNSKTEQNPAWLKMSEVFQTPSGIRIGLIGLTAPFYPFYDPLGWQVEDPIAVLDQYLTVVEKEADVIVILSHLGIDQDEVIAKRYPQIDVIIGGHTHHLFRDTERRKDTILTAAGKYGHYLGEIMLTWDHSQGKLIDKQAHTINVDHFPEEQNAKRLIDQQYQKALGILKQPITTLKSPLQVDWWRETELIHALTETLQEWTAADISMLNAGILLDSLPAGEVTYYDIHRICPHPINPCVVKLTGHELLEVIRVSLTQRYINMKIKGYGFRGEIMGKMVFTGIDLETTSDQNGELHIQTVKRDGKLLPLDQTYSVATADMFSFGHLSAEISRAKSKQFFMPEFMRDLLIHTLKKQQGK